MLIETAKHLSGSLTLPGDKSISHRAAMFASIAVGDTTIDNFATSVDCASTLDAMRRLDVDIERDGSTVRIKGAGRDALRPPAGPIDCGNSGTTMRLLSGILAGRRFDATLIGDESLSGRPMARVIGPLGSMGAKVDSADGKAPLIIRGGRKLCGVEHSLQIASAQIKSCILLAGLDAEGTTVVREPVTTRDHTERMLGWLGVDVEVVDDGNGRRISVEGGQQLTAADIAVPGDVSSAAFFLVAAACLGGSRLTLRNVGLNPTRTGILNVLTDLGVDLAIGNTRESGNEPVGDLTVTGQSPDRFGGHKNSISGELIANLIDEIPVLAILGTQMPGGLEVRGAGELRVKESDRIASVIENLRRMDASVEEFPDGFNVRRSELKGAKLNSFGDHRIAMAFAVAGLFAAGQTEITGSDCTDISFPGFFQTLRGLTA